MPLAYSRIVSQDVVIASRVVLRNASRDPERFGGATAL